MRNAGKYPPGSLVHAFGLNVKAARVAQGYTMEELAAKAGVGYNTVQRCEKAENALSIDTAARIARALGRSLSDLTGEEYW